MTTPNKEQRYSAEHLADWIQDVSGVKVKVTIIPDEVVLEFNEGMETVMEARHPGDAHNAQTIMQKRIEVLEQAMEQLGIELDG